MCVYAEISSLRYFITECSSGLCSMCQYNNERMIFRLQGLKNSPTIDNTYLMTRDDFTMPSLFLRGIYGGFKIGTYYGHYVIFQEGCNGLLAINNENSLAPVGIQQWHWTSNNCNSGMIQNTSIMLKLCNVSFVLKYIFWETVSHDSQSETLGNHLKAMNKNRYLLNVV